MGHQENRQRRKDLAHRFLADYLQTHPCMDCGYDNPLALEFDHVRGTKKKEVSGMAHLGYSMDLILEEIEKCEVVCANCHKLRTWNRMGGTIRSRLLEE